MDAYDFTALGVEFALQHEEEEKRQRDMENKYRRGA